MRPENAWRRRKVPPSPHRSGDRTLPKPQPNQVPAYRLHKQSGQAIVTLSGRDHLLGPHGSTESREKYDRLIAQWLANGRRAECRTDAAGEGGITVSRVIAEFWAHAKAYYVTPDGRPAPGVSASRLLRRHGDPGGPVELARQQVAPPL